MGGALSVDVPDGGFDIHNIAYDLASWQRVTCACEQGLFHTDPLPPIQPLAASSNNPQHSYPNPANERSGSTALSAASAQDLARPTRRVTGPALLAARVLGRKNASSKVSRTTISRTITRHGGLDFETAHTQTLSHANHASHGSHGNHASHGSHGSHSSSSPPRSPTARVNHSRTQSTPPVPPASDTRFHTSSTPSLCHNCIAAMAAIPGFSPTDPESWKTRRKMVLDKISSRVLPLSLATLHLIDRDKHGHFGDRDALRLARRWHRARADAQHYFSSASFLTRGELRAAGRRLFADQAVLSLAVVRRCIGQYNMRSIFSPNYPNIDPAMAAAHDYDPTRAAPDIAAHQKSHAAAKVAAARRTHRRSAPAAVSNPRQQNHSSPSPTDDNNSNSTAAVAVSSERAEEMGIALLAAQSILLEDLQALSTRLATNRGDRKAFVDWLWNLLAVQRGPRNHTRIASSVADVCPMDSEPEEGRHVTERELCCLMRFLREDCVDPNMLIVSSNSILPKNFGTQFAQGSICPGCGQCDASVLHTGVAALLADIDAVRDPRTGSYSLTKTDFLPVADLVMRIYSSRGSWTEIAGPYELRGTMKKGHPDADKFRIARNLATGSTEFALKIRARRDENLFERLNVASRFSMEATAIAMNEVNALKVVREIPNVLHLCEVLVSDKSIHIVTTLAGGGSLSEITNAFRNNPMPKLQTDKPFSWRNTIASAPPGPRKTSFSASSSSVVSPSNYGAPPKTPPTYFRHARETISTGTRTPVGSLLTRRINSSLDAKSIRAARNHNSGPSTRPNPLAGATKQHAVTSPASPSSSSHNNTATSASETSDMSTLDISLPEEKSVFNEPELRFMFSQLIRAVQRCHENGVAHRKIQMDNVFLENDGQVVLGDFGFATTNFKDEARTDFHGTYPGPLEYMAPELATTKTVSGRKADMWSLGVLLSWLAAGKTPFPALDSESQLDDMTQGNHRIPRNVSNSLRDFLASLINPNASLRLTPNEALTHEWFRDGPETSVAPRLNSARLIVPKRQVQMDTMINVVKQTVFAILSKGDIHFRECNPEFQQNELDKELWRLKCSWAQHDLKFTMFLMDVSSLVSVDAQLGETGSTLGTSGGLGMDADSQLVLGLERLGGRGLFFIRTCRKVEVLLGHLLPQFAVGYEDSTNSRAVETSVHESFDSAPAAAEPEWSEISPPKFESQTHGSTALNRAGLNSMATTEQANMPAPYKAYLTDSDAQQDDEDDESVSQCDVDDDIQKISSLKASNPIRSAPLPVPALSPLNAVTYAEYDDSFDPAPLPDEDSEEGSRGVGRGRPNVAPRSLESDATLVGSGDLGSGASGGARVFEVQSRDGSSGRMSQRKVSYSSSGRGISREDSSIKWRVERFKKLLSRRTDELYTMNR